MTVVASNFAKSINDLYQTEAWVTKALLRHFPVNMRSIAWEAAAGNHMMADVLRAAGATVITSDIATYERDHDAIFDFLDPKRQFNAACTHLITNPPYGRLNIDAVRFARLALARCNGWVMLLLTAKFDCGKRRVDLFRDNPRFAAKIVLVDRIRWIPGTDQDGTEDHAWYVWAPDPGIGIGQARIIYEAREVMECRTAVEQISVTGSRTNAGYRKRLSKSTASQ